MLTNKIPRLWSILKRGNRNDSSFTSFVYELKHSIQTLYKIQRGMKNRVNHPCSLYFPPFPSLGLNRQMSERFFQIDKLPNLPSDYPCTIRFKPFSVTVCSQLSAAGVTSVFSTAPNKASDAILRSFSEQFQVPYISASHYFPPSNSKKYQFSVTIRPKYIDAILALRTVLAWKKFTYIVDGDEGWLFNIPRSIKMMAWDI